MVKGESIKLLDVVALTEDVAGQKLRGGGRLGCRVLNPVSFLEEVAHADER